MSSRRIFLQQSAALGAGAIAGAPLRGLVRKGFPEVRTPVSLRRFRSPAIEETILRMARVIRDPEISWLFGNCFPNTLDTTVNYQLKDGKPDTFVITGDIQAMWLRDSSAQVWPYLPFTGSDPRLKDLVAGVINRQTACILIDPYANAFNEGPTGSPWDKDLTAMKPELHERKWELDSLCYPIRLAHGYWKQTGDSAPFSSEWRQAMRLVVATMKEQQRFSGPGPYRFGRVTSWSTDTVPGDGFGNPIHPDGLIVSVFRPSDDATIFPFLVPSNYFAIVSLRQLAGMSIALHSDHAFADTCLELSLQVETALKKQAVVDHPDLGRILAYEVDGYGNRLYMDDSNVPSLLALPYLEALGLEDPLYQQTRKFIFSSFNPYFFSGKYASGSGSPHTLDHKVWPLSIILRAMTSRSAPEISQCLTMLKRTHAGTGFMHESFNPDNPSEYTRKWFAWANTLFGEMILKLHREQPGLLAGSIF
ncbi:MAG TPA: glycoside hydrolase family 125 protein [Chitinophagaceae bacterium]|nr:glycoside hydrolase family 125 protein [Chitinophagaceae bacterium]